MSHVEQQKQQKIKKCLNFSTLPKDDSQFADMSYEQTLAHYYPWGCEHICQQHKLDQWYKIVQKTDRIENICLSIKYGICSFRQTDIKGIGHKLKMCIQQNKTLYVIFNEKEKGNKNIIALAQLYQINYDTTFRYWHIKEQFTSYPVGIAKIKVLAVGQIPHYQHLNIGDIYKNLKQSRPLQWKYFRAADDLQENQRRKHIQQIQKNQEKNIQKIIKSKTMALLEKNNQKN